MKIKGKDLTVFVEVGGVMTAVALSTGCELDVDREMVEVAGADDWRHYLPRLKGWKITTEQLMSDRSDVQGLIDGQAVKVCFGVQDGIQWCGMALVNRMTLTGQNGAMARYSVSMQGTGALADMGTAAGWDNAEAWNDAEAWPRGAAAAAGSTTVVTLINDPATHGDVLDAVNNNLQAIDDAFVADRKRLTELESTRWPDVRFAGVLDGSESVTSANVSQNGDGTNVFWSKTAGQFVIKVGASYYDKWNNAAVWNVNGTGRANVYYIAEATGIYMMRNGALVLMSGTGGGGLPGEAWPTAGFGGVSNNLPELLETALGTPNERDVYYMTRNRVFAWYKDGVYYVNFVTTTTWNASNGGTLEAKEKAYFLNVRTGEQFWYDGSGLKATGGEGGDLPDPGEAWPTMGFAKILDGTEKVETISQGVELTAEDVFYSPVQAAFVGRVFDGLVPKYYGNWGNASLWNDLSVRRPKSKCYFVAVSGQQYVYINNTLAPTVDVSGLATKEDLKERYRTVYFAGTVTDTLMRQSTAVEGTAETVYYSTHLNCFVVKYGSSYFSNWDNAAIWNADSGTAEPAPYDNCYYIDETRQYVYDGTELRLLGGGGSVEISQTLSAEAGSENKVLSLMTTSKELQRRYKTISFGGVLTESVSLVPAFTDVEAAAEDVFYFVPLKKFLLKAGSRYHTDWTNAYLWNDAATGMAYMDCYYMMGGVQYVFNGTGLVMTGAEISQELSTEAGSENKVLSLMAASKEFDKLVFYHDGGRADSVYGGAGVIDCGKA